MMQKEKNIAASRPLLNVVSKLMRSFNTSTQNFTHELPEVEDGENTVRLLWPLVKARNEPNNTQTFSQNKSAAILAEKHASHNPLYALKSERRLEPNLHLDHEINERVAIYFTSFEVNKLSGGRIVMAGARARVIFRQVSYDRLKSAREKMMEDNVLCLSKM